MPKVIPAIIAFVVLAVLSLPGCDNKNPDVDMAGETAPTNTQHILLGYGRDWPPMDCGQFPGFDLPPGTRICGVVGNDAGSPSEVVLARGNASSDTSRARLATVEVNSPDAPVVLLLSNDRNTIWRIKSTPGTEVLAAAASGNGRQAIMGLKPGSVNMVNNGRGNQRCGQFYQEKFVQSRALANFSNQSFGRNPDLIIEPIEGRAVCGWPAPPEVELLSYGDLDPKKYDAYADLMAALDKAVKSGQIRRAKLTDLKNFKEKISLDRHLLVKDQWPGFFSDSYVIESPDFVFPDELNHFDDSWGSAQKLFTFYIPEGLRLPEGSIEGGTRVLFMKDGACLGKMCGYGEGLYSSSGSPKFPAPDLKLPPKCRFDGLKLPENTKIYAGGGYSGKETGRKYTGNTKEIGQINVTVNSPEGPVVLILSAYDPVEWSLDIRPGTKVAAVLLSGYRAQKIINLPDGIPVVSGSYDEGGCWSFYFTREQYVKINHISENVFGRLPDRGFHAVDGQLVIDPSLPPRPVPAHYFSPPRTDEDDPGILEALAQGLIRPATSEVKSTWFRKHAESTGGDNLMEPSDYIYATRFSGYEILSEEFAFTENMQLQRQQEFYLPENMELPDGNPRSATIYLIDDGSCLGSMRGCIPYRR
jgi:hypothetical protein